MSVQTVETDNMESYKVWIYSIPYHV